MVRTAARWFVFAVALVHALMQLLGTAAGLGWVDIEQLTEPISTTAGVAWSVSAIVTLTAAVMMAVRNLPPPRKLKNEARLTGRCKRIANSTTPCFTCA
jgi:hypothetical protein